MYIVCVIFIHIFLTGTFALVENNPLFNTSLQHSYKCFKRQTFNLTNENSNVTAGFIHLQHVQLQAFRNTTGTVFAEGKPIFIMCCLSVCLIKLSVIYFYLRRFFFVWLIRYSDFVTFMEGF